MNKQKDLYRMTVIYAFYILAYFFVTAIIGYYIGSMFDQYVFTYPVGTILSMVVTYFLSLALALYFAKKKNLLGK